MSIPKRNNEYQERVSLGHSRCKRGFTVGVKRGLTIKLGLTSGSGRAKSVRENKVGAIVYH